MTKKIILFTLQSFSSTGGIQKMTRTLGHALHILSERKGWDFAFWSLYDSPLDLMTQYLPPDKFRAFNHNDVWFVLRTAFLKKKPDIVVLSHINLSIIGLIIKMMKPGAGVWLIAHGIEVWRPLSFFQRLLLKHCDKIVCVSSFTKKQMIACHGTPPAKCVVLNNAVDPFMKLPSTFKKPERLIRKYRFGPDNPILFTLTRLASTEQYKGHDQVIKAVSQLKKQFPGIRYILAGQYDHREEIRIQKLITEFKVDHEVILTGYIEENELADYFLLADLFVLPSKKEGFGIVFIEAMACGLPVICGSVDGSLDAIRNGELGKAVNPDNLTELTETIAGYLNSPLSLSKRYDLQKQCLSHFNEDDYMESIDALVSSMDNSDN